jgi:hypothetical protein
VGTFVPKPHTPFQWVACDTPEMIEAKQDVLRHKLRDRNIKLTWAAIEDTMLEAWLTRGDRRMAEVIYTAWKNGAKFDAWQDQYRYKIWEDAFSSSGLKQEFYTHRKRQADEIFPWENISAGIRKNHLYHEYEKSLKGIITDDCREGCYACGILPTFADLRRENPGEVWKCPEVKSPKREAAGQSV